MFIYINMAVEVFTRKGEGQMYSDSFSSNNNFNNSYNNHNRFKKRDEDDSDESFVKVESKGPISAAKKEFMEELEDESLTVDACDGLNREWGKK